ncbi:hypothetical protein FRX31_019012, partial [Thalictrum thalictroides]
AVVDNSLSFILKDSLELEDNKFSSRTSSNPSIVGKEIHDRLVVESKEIADGTVTVGESVVSLADVGTPEFMKKSNASVGSESSGLNAAQSEVKLQTVSRCASGRSNGACQSQMNAAK